MLKRITTAIVAVAMFGATIFTPINPNPAFGAMENQDDPFLEVAPLFLEEESVVIHRGIFLPFVVGSSFPTRIFRDMVSDQLGLEHSLTYFAEECHRLTGEAFCTHSLELVDGQLGYTQVPAWAPEEPFFNVKVGEKWYPYQLPDSPSEEEAVLLLRLVLMDVLHAEALAFRQIGDLRQTADLEEVYLQEHLLQPARGLCRPEVACRLDFARSANELLITLTGVNQAEGYDLLPEGTQFFCLTVRQEGEAIPQPEEAGYACTSSVEEALGFIFYSQ